ncbi:hypothetical protein [Geomesophilobacter sediminis]|uniref:Uncharacterized protein n=1 Tax=Geomesophilobacter sediminis TaxID=2798584 RepID=A0A8J7IMF1_9BACT|nr:hypothetical protein [Geomesophilobacter sediminis]MBJ6723903.1 hypothetical protein [Geomesophilobacter sediminis]
MIRKTIALILCLTTLAPAAAGAQEASGALNPPAPVERRVTERPSVPPELNLPRATEEKIQLAQNDTTAPAREQETRDRSCGGFRNWVDIHLGGYRWIYWAVAAGALIAIHAAH